MTWHEVRVDHMVREVRQITDPRQLDYHIVEHYSIPSLEETGQPDLIHPDEILSNKQLLTGGEVMVSRLNPRKARVVRVPDYLTNTAIASGEFIIMNATAVDANYLVYLLLSEEVRQHLHSCVQSVTRSHQRIRPEHLLKMSLRIPEKDFQVAIADYLDTETARIDALVAKKRRLIELLAEYRTALITETVTKGLPPDAAKSAGLDPHPPLKPSRVDWLGDIPTHWQVIHLRRCVRRIKTGTTPPADQLSDLLGDDIAWFSPGDIGEVLQLRPPSRTLTNRAIAEGFTPLFPAESTLIVGIGATTGRVGYNAQSSTGNQQLTCIVGSELTVPRFLAWQLWAHSEYIRAVVPYSTLPILNNELLLSLPFLVPPVEEQSAIAMFLDRQTERCNTLSDRLESAIELLQEYRSALITAAVTGEINVAGPNDTHRSKGETP